MRCVKHINRNEGFYECHQLTSQSQYNLSTRFMMEADLA